MDELDVSVESIGGEEYTLTVDSTPQGVLFSISELQTTTPFTQLLVKGSYTIKMPDSTYDGKPFKSWEDGSTNSTRTINLTSDMNLKATYEGAVEEEEEEAVKHTLTVESDPSNQLFSISEMQYITPYTEKLGEGSYTIKMPDSTYDGKPFETWEDGSTNPERTINLTADMTIKATYKTPEEEEEEEEEEVTAEHLLKIESDPTSKGFSINGVTATTPYSKTLQEGSYTIIMPSENFKSWEDGSTNSTRTINLTSDMNLKATYEGEAPKSQCEEQYGDWGLLNALRNLICDLQGIPTE